MSSCFRLLILGAGTLLAGVGSALAVATSLCARPPEPRSPDCSEPWNLFEDTTTWPDGLAAPEVPLLPQRRLDPSALHVSSPIGPDAELAAIRAELQALADAVHGGADLRYACIDERLGPRLALF